MLIARLGASRYLFGQMAFSRLPDPAKRLCLLMTCIALVLGTLAFGAGAMVHPAQPSAHHEAHFPANDHGASDVVNVHAHHHGGGCCENEEPQTAACHNAVCCAFATDIVLASTCATPVESALVSRFVDLGVIEYDDTLPERPPRRS